MFSKIIRRTHMYLALFLTPWILMYSLSTIGMNHSTASTEAHRDASPQFVQERVLPYQAPFPSDARPGLMARRILDDLKMSGAHGFRMSPDSAQLIINRAEPIAPRRITFFRAESKLLIERQVFRGTTFLEGLHRRRGFESDYPVEDSWAFLVDLVIVAILFWVASGLWMWWELKVTRLWGAAFAGTGLVIFTLFLFAM